MQELCGQQLKVTKKSYQYSKDLIRQKTHGSMLNTKTQQWELRTNEH